MRRHDPGGTDDLTTSTVCGVETGAMLRMAPSTADRSAEPSGEGGVGTARKTAAAPAAAAALSAWKVSSPASMAPSTSASSPGS